MTSAKFDPISPCRHLDLIYRDKIYRGVQRWAKRWTCFVKQQPGRARLKFLAT